MRRLVVALVSVAAFLGGCATIPTSGPIETGDVVLSEPGPAIPLASDPQPDGAPEVIINGFLAAGTAGLSNNFLVARKYLTEKASSEWEPTARILVYPLRGGPQIHMRSKDTAVVTMSVEGTLDRTGVYSEAVPGATEELAVRLVRNGNDQWRISSLDNVVLLSAADFDNFYRKVPLYFASRDGQRLVPDLRWFLTEDVLVSSVRALLAGPSAWLRDAVSTGVPDGVRVASVTLAADQAAAVVDLSAAAENANEAQRSLLIAQLRATLGAIPGQAVHDVIVTAADGLPWEATGAQPQRAASPGDGPFFVAGGHLAELRDRKVAPVGGIAPLPDGVRSVAISLDERIVVALSGDHLVILPSDRGAAVDLLEGTALLPPSIDRFGWIWTCGQNAGDGIVAVDSTGTRTAVRADWLDSPAVQSIAVSPDGTRVAIVHTDVSDQQVAVDVAPILRDRDNRPTLLGDAFRVADSVVDATQVEWSDETTLAVLGRDDSAVSSSLHLAPVGGPTSALPLVDGAASVAAGRGDRGLYLGDKDGRLFLWQGSSWALVANDVISPVFPG